MPLKKDLYLSEYADELPRIPIKYKWIVPSDNSPFTDMTEILTEYRTRSIKENAKPHKLVEPVQLLSIDCIYLFDMDTSASQFTRNPVQLAFSRKDQYESLPDAVVLWARQVIEVFQDESKGAPDIEDLLLTFKVNAAEMENDLVQAYARILYDEASTLFGSKMLYGDTLVHYHLHSPLHWIFAADRRLSCNWANVPLEFCKGVSSGSVQPNFTAYTEIADQRFDLFVVEVKKPDQPEGSDLIKVGFMLRKMLVELIERKVANPEVYALIANGYNCRTYKMSITHPYVFKLIELAQFELPDRAHKLACLELTAAALNQVKRLVLNVRTRIETRYDEMIDKVAPTDFVPIRFIPPTVESRIVGHPGPSWLKRTTKTRGEESDDSDDNNDSDDETMGL